jgi:membrane protein required for colicin V production
MDSLQLNWLDYTIIGLVVLSIVGGAIRGLIKEVLPLVSLVVAIVLSYKVGPELQPYVLDWLKNDTAAYVFAFVTVFLVAWILIGLLGGMLTKLVKATAAGPLDKLFGGILGLVRGIAVAVILVVALLAFMPDDSPALRESSLAAPTLTVGQIAITLMPDDIKDDLRARYKDLKNKASKRVREELGRPHPDAI